MRKGNAKKGIVVGMLCMMLAVVGIVALSSDASLLVDSMSTDLEALLVLSSNLTNLSFVVTDERSESEASETSNSAVELYLEHQKNIVNARGWNEYIISITNPNEEDIQKTIYLEGTRYNWDTLQVTVPVPLKATGERNFYIFKVRSN